MTWTHRLSCVNKRKRKQNITANIYFGNRLNDITKLELLKKRLQLEHLFLLKQTHSTQGYCVDDGLHAEALRAKAGDFLVTNTPNIAIGVITADCLPIVLVDTERAAVGVVHAGWRGAVGGIISNAVAMMHKQYGTSPVDLQVFFGTSAKMCCYEVQDNFCKMAGILRFIVSRDGKQYFDNVAYCTAQLIDLGVLEAHIDCTNNVCTVCNHTCHSYRRDGERAGRQITAVMINLI